MPSRIPNFRHSEEESIQCKQLNYSTAWMWTTQLWNNSLVLQLSNEETQLWNSTVQRQRPFPDRGLCSTLFCSFLSCFPLQRHLWCQLQPGKCSQSRVFGEKGELCSLSHRGADVYREKSQILVPDLFILMKMRNLNSCSLIGLKSTVLTDQYGAPLLVGKDVNGSIAVQLLLNKESFSPTC